MPCLVFPRADPRGPAKRRSRSTSGHAGACGCAEDESHCRDHDTPPIDHRYPTWSRGIQLHLRSLHGRRDTVKIRFGEAGACSIRPGSLPQRSRPLRGLDPILSPKRRLVSPAGARSSSTPSCVWGLMWGIWSNEPHPASSRSRRKSVTSVEQKGNCDPPGPRSWPEVVDSNPDPVTTTAAAPPIHCAAAREPTLPATGSLSGTGRVQTRA
jgi:hypothetical protein